MRAYKALIIARLKLLLQYRSAAWAGFFTQTAFGLMRIMVFSGFYAQSTAPLPMSIKQVHSYIWLGQALLTLLPFRTDGEIALLIRNGNLAYELVRPLDLYNYWFCRALALRTVPVLLRAAPGLIFAFWLLPLLGLGSWALQPPVGFEAGIGFGISLCMAVLISSAITVLTSVAMLSSLSPQGIESLMPVAIWGLSGIIVPLAFFPDWLKTIFYLLPFRSLIDVPFQIYLGTLHGWAVWAEIGLQGIWVLILALCGRVLLDRALQKVIIQGG